MTEPGIRQRIVRAALALIGSEGVAGVTNRKIAAAAGVSLGSITYHFATQRELLTESLVQFVRAETERLTRTARAWEGEVTTFEQAALIVDQLAREAVDPDADAIELAPFELFIHAGREPAMRQAATDSFTAYDVLATTVLRALDVEDPDSLAPHVVALVLGLQIRRIATGDTGVEIADALNKLRAT